MYDPMSDGNIFFKRLPVRFEGYMPVMIFNWIDIYSKKYYQCLKEALVKQLRGNSIPNIPKPPSPKVTRKNYKPEEMINTKALPRKAIKDIRKTLKTIGKIQNPSESMSIKNRPIVKVLEDDMPGTKKQKRRQEKRDRDVVAQARKAARMAAAEHLPPGKSSKKSSSY